MESSQLLRSHGVRSRDSADNALTFEPVLVNFCFAVYVRSVGSRGSATPLSKMSEETVLASTVEANPPAARQRKKRKWDQPAEAVLAAGVSIRSLGCTGLSAILPSIMGMMPSVTNVAANPNIPSTLPFVQQNAVAIAQKINQDLVSKGLVPQPKIQDELIAREIVINDAESSIRYKLTKRQTQEEIQAKTGAVVITRGKYKPPNGPVDHEKPLYLHVSAGAHLKDTAERIRAVDQAVALVDDILKQGRVSSFVTQLPCLANNDTHPLSVVVFVDHEAYSLPGLINRIRGPNDQYINHIMNETGATVTLKGSSCDNLCLEEPFHLCISANNPKSLGDAKILSENLLETIRAEVGGSRPPYFPPAVSYNLQQPIHQQISGLERGAAHLYPCVQQLPVPVSAAQPPLVVSTTSAMPSVDMLTGIEKYNIVLPLQHLSGEQVGKNLMMPQGSHPAEMKHDGCTSISPLPYPVVAGPNSQQVYGNYPQLSQGSQSFSAYTGLYPQASPLQQVALALQRPPSIPTAKPNALPIEDLNPEHKAVEASMPVEKQEKQRRKFRELPVPQSEPLLDQVRLLKKEEHSKPVDVVGNKQQLMPALKGSPSNMLPPPARVITNMGPPPLPMSSTHSTKVSTSIMVMPPSRRAMTDMGPPPSISTHSTRIDPSTTSTGLPGSLESVSLKKESSSKTYITSVQGIKLVEYGEEEEDGGGGDDDDDDDDDDVSNVDARSPAPVYANGKPFWAA